MTDDNPTNIAYDGLPCVRLKKLRHEGGFVTEEFDFYVQDYELERAIKGLKDLMKLSKEVNKK